MSQEGIIDVVGSNPQIPTEFVANVGFAVPIANVLEILGSVVAAGTNPLRTVGSGNTIDIQAQISQAIGATNATNIGLSAFNSSDFNVDANGFVSLLGPAASATFTVDTFTPPGTNPVVPDAGGNINITGGQIAAGTTTNVIRTDSLAVDSYTIQIQRSSAQAVSTIGANGVAHFSSAMFSVDANGFVTLSGGGQAVDSIAVQTGTSPVVPTAAGLITINGAVVAAGTNPVRSDGTGANTLAIEVQISQALAAADATKIGLANFDSSSFAVAATGFVSASGTGLGKTITGQSGGALSPTAGNWNIFGASTAAGTSPVVTSGSGSTLTVNVQTSQALAASDATKIGLANFDSAAFDVNANGFVQLNGGGIAATAFDVQANTAPGTDPVVPTAAGVVIVNGAVVANHSVVLETRSRAVNAYNVEVQYATSAAATDGTKSGVAHFNSSQFTVDSSGFVATSGTGVANTITGDSGGALSPTAGNWNLLGSGSITTVGSGSTLTTQLTGLTNHAVLVGAGTTTITKVGPTSTAGQVLQSAGAAADPAFSTATYPLTTTVSQILYSSATNVVSGLATTNRGVLTTSATGVPVITALATDGQLIIGSTAGAPAAATLTAGAGISITNGSNSITIATASIFGKVIVQTFAASGTYTPSSGMLYCTIECIGAGGGGGGTATTGATTISIGGGAGGGGYARKVVTAATVGASQTVTIGAAGTAGAVGGGNGGTGGTTSVGSLCVATGGAGGAGSGAATSALFIVGSGSGGIGTTGDVLASGNPGSPGFGSSTSTFVTGGNGGSSAIGGGAIGTAGTGVVAGTTGRSYGGGGSGATVGLSQTQQAGGAGAPGFVIITEFTT